MKQKINAQETRRLVLAGFFACLGLVVPFAVSHAFGIPGTIFLPMHIPILLCGLLCGPQYGALCGIIVPVLSSVLTGMPAAYPMLPIMACELFTYGLVSGIVRQKITRFVYPSLLLAMIAGRVVYGVAFALLTAMNAAPLKALSVRAAVATGLPGILIQLILIPIIVHAIQKNANARQGDPSAFDAAKSLLNGKTVSCVVMRGSKIIYQDFGRGVSPLIRLYESDPGKFRDSFVADKIIGKAAAMILICGGAKAVYGEIMSTAAKAYLEQHHVQVSYGICVDVISNREGNGICPIEKSVLNIDDPHEGYAVLLKTVRQMQSAS